MRAVTDVEPDRAAIDLLRQLHRALAEILRAAESGSSNVAATAARVVREVLAHAAPGTRPGRRVTVREAIAGAPGLPPTPASTLYDWLGNWQAARVLDVDPSRPRRTQRPLVEGLLELQARRCRPRSLGIRGARR